MASEGSAEAYSFSFPPRFSLSLSEVPTFSFHAFITSSSLVVRDRALQACKTKGKIVPYTLNLEFRSITDE
jgi:hypothetical protein